MASEVSIIQSVASTAVCLRHWLQKIMGDGRGGGKVLASLCTGSSTERESASERHTRKVPPPGTLILHAATPPSCVTPASGGCSRSLLTQWSWLRLTGTSPVNKSSLPLCFIYFCGKFTKIKLHACILHLWIYFCPYNHSKTDILHFDRRAKWICISPAIKGKHQNCSARLSLIEIKPCSYQML